MQGQSNISHTGDSIRETTMPVSFGELVEFSSVKTEGNSTRSRGNGVKCMDDVAYNNIALVRTDPVRLFVIGVSNPLPPKISLSLSLTLPPLYTVIISISEAKDLHYKYKLDVYVNMTSLCDTLTHINTSPKRKQVQE